MTQKCALCKKEIKTTFLDKLDGTIIKIKERESLKKYYICSACQKKYGKNLKNKISKL